MVDLIYGESGSGKSTRCIELMQSVLNSKNKDKKIVLIVPDQFSHIAEKSIVDRFGSVSGETVMVLTFSRIVNTCFNHVIMPVRDYLKPCGKNILAYKSVQKNKKQLKVFAGSMQKTGFTQVIMGLIAEFKRYMVTPDMLDKTVAESNCDQMLKEKIGEISMIYRSYDEFMQNGYYDSDDDLARAAHIIETTDVFDGAYVYIDEFSDFLPQHYEVISALNKKATALTVTLCMDDAFLKDGIFAPCVNTYNRLGRLFGIRTSEYLTNKGPYISDELEYLKHNFAQIQKNVSEKKTEDIRLFEASDIYSEADFVAREIIKLCRESGYRFGDIAVVCGNVENYTQALKTTFSTYGINHFLDFKASVLTNNIPTLLFSVMDVLITNFGYNAVFSYLKTGLTPICDDDIDILENHVLKTGLSYVSWLDEEKWLNASNRVFGRADEQTQNDLEKINSIRKRVVEPFVKLKNSIDKDKTVKGITTAVFEFLQDINLYDTIDKRIRFLTNTLNKEKAQQYSQVWNILMELFNQLVVVCGDEKTGFEQYKKMLEAGLSGYEIGVIPPAKDVVTVTDAKRSRLKDIKAVFIIGATYGSFPNATAEEGILSDAERLSLGEMGINIAPDTATGVFNEQFLMYKTLSLANEKLWITYPVADSENKALRPCYMISQIKQVYPNIALESNLMFESDAVQNTLVSLPLPTFNHMAAALRKKHDSMPYAKVWDSVESWYKTQPEFSHRCDALEKAYDDTHKKLKLSDATVSQLYSRDMLLSATQLESFSQCEFMYFLRYTLNAAERKVLKVEAPDIGIILHDAMERFCRRVEKDADSQSKDAFEQKQQAWKGLTNADAHQIIREIIDETRAEVVDSQRRNKRKLMYLLKRIENTVVCCVDIMTQNIRLSEFVPYDYEKPFRYSVTLENNIKAHIKGIIDRLDILKTENETYISIVDYKSGSKDFSLSGIYNRTDIQLMLYMEAALNDNTLPHAKPASVLYYSLKRPALKYKVPPETSSLLLQIRKALKMKGLVLDNTSVIEKLDSSLADENVRESAYLPLSYKKDGNYTAASSVADAETFNSLTRYTADTVKTLANAIARGEIDINPIKQGNRTPCDYCRYSSVCMFEDGCRGFGFRRLKSLKKDDVTQILNEIYGREEG